ncbi:hypothetical protein [Coleofasciculus sp. FACHB-SPT9]|uniref:hypothetical protein n=1 Tax=Cyanophyceae TaxID=3028117 RepID=UPI0016834BF6|nr:hypothetical protein [Coleofasciculus sp. FACHB-SPT9]MBD1887950.1 hypothetical protein [Coleofasciculus sp. FACHB-SPT9]
MTEADKKAVEQAKRKKSSGSTGSKRSQVNAEQAQTQITDKIALARRKTANAVKAQIVGGGIADALYEISVGDFGDIAEGVIDAFDDFIDGIDNQSKRLEAAENDPKFLLAAGEFSGSSSLLSYSTTEAEEN